MFDSLGAPPFASETDAVAHATRVASDVCDRLPGIAARMAAIAVDMDWRAPSSRAFHDRVQELQGRLSTAQARAETAVDALRRVRADLDARMWSGLP